MIRPPSKRPVSRRPLAITDFLGADETGTDDIRRSPNMLNCILDDEGTPEMRTGYEKAYPTSLGAGPMLGQHQWSSSETILHHGTKLYSFNGTDQPTEAYDGMDGTKTSHSFELGTKMCIFDGSIIVVYDGTTFEDILDSGVAYTPTFLIGTPPTGGGTRVEDLNLLNPSWYQQFSTVLGTLEYTLHGAPLDSLDSLVLGITTLVVTTDYTVNLTTGVITLVADPGAGTNNLIAKVTDSSLLDATLITKCRVSAIYGGPNDSRVFMTGNPDYPHIDWWTGLPLSGAYDPTYWPDTNYDRIGGDNEAVVGYSVQNDRMIINKDASIYLRSWELEVDGYGRTVMRFPSVPLNDFARTYDADSIELLVNDPFFLTQRGVYAVVASQVRDERNVKAKSTLVSIPASGRGVAIDFEDKYYLAVGDDEVWVCDYRRSVKDNASGEYQPVWYKWDNVPVNTWHTDGDELFFGSIDAGMVYRFKRNTELYPYNDDGAAIEVLWDTIFTGFGRDDQTKLVQNIIIKQKKWSRGEIQVEYITEEGSSGVIHTERVVLIDFNNIDFSDFSFGTSRIPESFNVRVDDAREIQSFKLVLTGSGVADEFFGFDSISMVYQYLGDVRF